MYVFCVCVVVSMSPPTTLLIITHVIDVKKFLITSQQLLLFMDTALVANIIDVLVKYVFLMVMVMASHQTF